MIGVFSIGRAALVAAGNLAVRVAVETDEDILKGVEDVVEMLT